MIQLYCTGKKAPDKGGLAERTSYYTPTWAETNTQSQIVDHNTKINKPLVKIYYRREKKSYGTLTRIRSISSFSSMKLLIFGLISSHMPPSSWKTPSSWNVLLTWNNSKKGFQNHLMQGIGFQMFSCSKKWCFTEEKKKEERRRFKINVLIHSRCVLDNSLHHSR